MYEGFVAGGKIDVIVDGFVLQLLILFRGPFLPAGIVAHCRSAAPITTRFCNHASWYLGILASNDSIARGEY